MARWPGKILVLLAILLAFANAGCFARCVVQSCQDSPPPCHSHGSNNDGSTKHCPQQNQMRAATTSAVTLDWGVGFAFVEWPAEVTASEPVFISGALTGLSPTVLAPLALRI